MRHLVIPFLLYQWILLASCTTGQNPQAGPGPDSLFTTFQARFLDSFWKENPGQAIFEGYGKYYDRLSIPDSLSFARTSAFSSQWLDSLYRYDYAGLSSDNQINFRIIENELKSDRWYVDTFRIQQWDPAKYNLGGECYYILTQPYAPLAERLKTLSAHLRDADGYFPAALKTIRRPTRDYTELAISQNQGSLEIFASMIPDSIKASSLQGPEKDSLEHRVSRALRATNQYIASLKMLVSNPSTEFRDFRIGKDLFRTKFRYDLVTAFTPEQMFEKADSAKKYYHRAMFVLADSLWGKYYPGQTKPEDSLELIKVVLSQIGMQHASPANVVHVASGMVHRLEEFIIRKDLFDYDTTYPLQVRVMPAFMAGVSLANAEFTPPYLKSGVTYYNVSDLSRMPPAAAESELREYNNYSLELLSIHEAMPGHCLQGVYNHKKSNSIVKSVFENGAMVEGWAVYCEQMMVENGWGNNSAEMRLVLYKWRLRELGNVMVDYGLQCLGWSKSDIINLLKKETFQEDAQIEEKYHRAAVSQVQLCSYFTGLTEILSLREAYKQKMSHAFRLKDFHEKFLSYGSAPVMYIREMMLK
jgi:uncharacterized protein (DUF885 family)